MSSSTNDAPSRDVNKSNALSHSSARWQNQISWIRRRDWHILSSGAQLYTNDERFGILHTPGSNTWTLQIKFVQKRDNGLYECQVSWKKSCFPFMAWMRTPNESRKFPTIFYLVSFCCFVQLSFPQGFFRSFSISRKANVRLRCIFFSLCFELISIKLDLSGFLYFLARADRVNAKQIDNLMDFPLKLWLWKLYRTEPGFNLRSRKSLKNYSIWKSSTMKVEILF